LVDVEFLQEMGERIGLQLRRRAWRYRAP